jgi:hypothetical protein
MIKKELLDDIFRLIEERKRYNIFCVRVGDKYVWMYEHEYKKYSRKQKLKELNVFDEKD